MNGCVAGSDGVNIELETTAISPAINTLRETALDAEDKDILHGDLSETKDALYPTSELGPVVLLKGIR